MFDIKINGDVTNLLSSIIEITKEIGNIPKKGYNSDSNYNYVLERDVTDALKKALTDRGIAVIPNIVDTSERAVSLNNGKSAIVSKVIMSYTFFDTKTGGYITTYGAGEGQDKGENSLDKGIYIAITGCQKYMLLKTFMISTGDDPEGDGPEKKDIGNKPDYHPIRQDQYQKQKTQGSYKPDDKISDEAINRLLAKGGENKNKFNIVLSNFGYKSVNEVKFRHLRAIDEALTG